MDIPSKYGCEMLWVANSSTSLRISSRSTATGSDHGRLQLCQLATQGFGRSHLRVVAGSGPAKARSTICVWSFTGWWHMSCQIVPQAYPRIEKQPQGALCQNTASLVNIQILNRILLVGKLTWTFGSFWKYVVVCLVLTTPFWYNISPVLFGLASARSLKATWKSWKRTDWLMEIGLIWAVIRGSSLPNIWKSSGRDLEITLKIAGRDSPQHWIFNEQWSRAGCLPSTDHQLTINN